MDERDLKVVGIAVATSLGLMLLFSPYPVGVGRDGCFPFPLLILGIVGFIVWRRRNAGNGNGGSGPFGGRGGRPPRFFEEWHERAHASGQPQPGQPWTGQPYPGQPPVSGPFPGPAPQAGPIPTAPVTGMPPQAPAGPPQPPAGPPPTAEQRS